MRTGELLYEDLSEKIIGAAMTVLNELGPGLNEKIYENAMVLELHARNMQAAQQTSFPVHYRGRFVGKLITDLIVDDLVVVETKVVENFDETHVAQTLSYLAITGVQLGLLLNFRQATLKWRRVVQSK